MIPAGMHMKGDNRLRLWSKERRFPEDRLRMLPGTTGRRLRIFLWRRPLRKRRSRRKRDTRQTVRLGTVNRGVVRMDPARGGTVRMETAGRRMICSRETLVRKGRRIP